uniref:Serpentine receptor class gamma n=1 Tax=Globodera rostochiensis TaxID=31243 RepID=A0A914I3P2_GLORO
MDIYVPQAVSLLLALPSVLLYVTECVVILRFWRHCFATSFFRLFLLLAANNLLLNFVLYIPSMRISEVGLFYELYMSMPDWVPKTFFCLSFFTFHFENFLTMVVIAHRLSAIVRPLDFEELWSRFFLIVVAAGVLICLALITPIALMDNIHFNADIKRTQIKRIVVSYRFRPGEKVFNAYKFLFICSVLALATSTALNLATIFAYKWHKRTRTATLTRQRTGGESCGHFGIPSPRLYSCNVLWSSAAFGLLYFCLFVHLGLRVVPASLVHSRQPVHFAERPPSFCENKCIIQRHFWWCTEHF